MGLKETAIEYANAGFSVFPLVARGKVPVVKNGLYEATTDPIQIEMWWTEFPNANIGIATGEVSGNIAVIDLDIKPDKGVYGDISLKDWESEHGAFPDTVCAMTGSGGRHLYFKVNKAFSSSRGILDGVDVRCNGGYVVAPGSIHENGNPYYWDISPDEMEIAPANSSVLALLEKHTQEVNKTTFKSPETIRSGARVDTLFRMVCSMQAQAYSDDAIIACIRTENAQKCEPPLSDKELEKEVFPALKRYEKGISYDKKPKTKLAVAPLVMHTAASIDKMDLPPITFHVDSILADGVTILSAKSKFYKSWLCLQMALSISQGLPFMGYRTHKSDVIYFDLENDIRLTQDRLRKLTHGAELPDNLYIVNECCRMGLGFEEQITQALEENPNIGLIILDVLQKVKYNRTGNQSDYDCDYKTLSFLKTLTAGRPLSIICVHHNRKWNDESDPFSNILGSTALMGATDEEIVIYKKNRSDRDATISITGRTLRSLDLIGYFDTEKYSWVIRGAQEELFEEERIRRHEKNGLTVLIKEHLLKDANEWQGTSEQILRMAKEQGLIVLDANNNKISTAARLGRILNSKEYRNNLELYNRISLTQQSKTRAYYFYKMDDGFDNCEEEGLPFPV